MPRFRRFNIGEWDFDGEKLILDDDRDTTITCDTDDQIDIEISGADDFQFTANSFAALSGSVITTNTINETTATSGVTIDGVLLKDSEVTTDTINEKTSTAGVTLDGVLLKDSEVTTDVINEKTSTAGVTADGVQMKDSQVYTDTINEKTGAAGVTIDGVKLKDSEVTTDVINEKTGSAGVTIDSATILDGTIQAADVFTFLAGIEREVRRPLIVPSDLGATTANGGATLNLGNSLQVSITTTASGAARKSALLRMLNDGEDTNIIDWGKKLLITFDLEASQDDAGVTGRVLIKTTDDDAVLSDMGLGIEINNLSVVGESYGSARAETAEIVALTAGDCVKVAIEWDGSTTITWYVDGTAVATQTTSANLPSGAANGCYIAISAVGQTGAGVSRFDVGNLCIIQGR